MSNLVGNGHHRRVSGTGPSSLSSGQSNWSRLQRHFNGTSEVARSDRVISSDTRRQHLSADVIDLGCGNCVEKEIQRAAGATSSSVDGLLNGTGYRRRQMGSCDEDLDDFWISGNNKQLFGAVQSESFIDRKRLDEPWSINGRGRGQEVTILVQNASTETVDGQRSYAGLARDNVVSSRHDLDAVSTRPTQSCNVVEDVELPPVDFRTGMFCLSSCDKVLFRHSTTIT